MGICCGVDIIEIDRIKKLFERMGDSIINRIFTQNEIDYCESKKKVRHKSYAARFAAKEAVAKSFGTGLGKGVSWKEIEVLNDENGRAYVVLNGRAKEIFDEMCGTDISISLSHCEKYAVACAVMQTARKDDN